MGVRGSGKSTFLETIGMQHLQKGNSVCDLYGSRDGEGLCWLRSPLTEDKKVLLACSENASVKSSYEVKQAAKVTLKDIEANLKLIASTKTYQLVNLLGYL